MHMDRRTLLIGASAIAGFAAAPALAAGQRGIEGVVGDGARLRRVFSGGRWCEGPVWDRRTSSLVFSDVRSNLLLRLGENGDATPIRAPSNFSNGNGFDREGRLVTCEHLTRRIVRQEFDGRLTVLADQYRGRRLNAPNDLAVAPDGAVWFTDPTFGLTQPEEGRTAPSEQPGRFVFRLDPDGSLAVVADGFEQPNGIVFSPDRRTLYVSDTSGGDGHEGRREVRAFDVVGGRRLARERVFATVASGVPDGLTVDAAGRLFAATDQGATVWDRTGALLGHIAAPTTCGNLAFGERDGRRLFLCAGECIYAIDLETRGAAWT